MSSKIGNIVSRVVLEAKGDISQVDRLVRTHISRLKITDNRERNKMESEAIGRALAEVIHDKERREEQAEKEQVSKSAQ